MHNNRTDDEGRGDIYDKRRSNIDAVCSGGTKELCGRERGKASGLYKLYGMARVGGENSEIHEEGRQAGIGGRDADSKLHG